jgi:NAD(P)-dependent dehydrogenase (short-subunit alcohol dehydrogenase family)
MTKTILLVGGNLGIGLATFLLSDDSAFITGQTLRPDGGLSSIRTF